MDKGKGVPDKWAVLIGIEYYEHPAQPTTTPRYGHLGNKIEYKTLRGCVNDVLAVEQYLVDTINVNPEHVIKLLAPEPGRKYLSQLPPGTYRRPTYDNIVDALKVPEGAKQGDFVYVHFSGHGARATTVFPELKDRSANDEDQVLVPSDITRGGKYIRDLEIGILLQAMTRGIPEVYKSDPQLDLPGNIDRIMHWGRQRPWMQAPQGFVVLAACEEYQKAHEIYLGDHSHGLLTHVLLSILRNGPVEVSSQAFYEGIRARVQDSNRNQTPYLIGDKDRFFFSDKLRSRVHALTVNRACVDRRKELIDRWVRLAGGKLHGVEELSEYAILPWSFDLGKRIEETDIIARVRVTEVMTGESIASFTQTDRVLWEKIVEGCPAVLQQLPIVKKSTVYFAITDDKVKEDFERDWHGHDGNRTWLHLNENGVKDTSFTVSIDKSGNFEIRERSGNFTQAIRNAVRPLPAAAPDNMRALIRRLEHLARFKMTKALANPGSRPGTSSALISIKVDAPAEGWELPSGQKVPPAEIKEWMAGAYELDEEKLFRVTIQNQSDRPLGCAVLNCGAELGVEHLFPPREPYYRLREGETKKTYFWMQVAPELRAPAKDGVAVVDTLKIFVCDPPRSLDALQLQGLGEMEDAVTRSGISERSHDLEDLLGDLGTSWLRHCIPTPGAQKADWETADVRIRIRPLLTENPFP
ncbi:hypothetical protein GGTG_13927 [Gaeumannomyces tritici R3-111a-1]|uniref:Peptidase C14 caspase domain-containing protein n=1 Tax=Gaeumannomyces tritici (strain R3-111a-1) TaxID=644352 RepID=J3PK77_GAET3|nr:hypothetical protein GGTG_13927 [Gaeumannomyces tritici R3-111a-1]EJT68497.1 hypothetical protein GGTG_13927 [Gaeumannomyces tritici R3-111a-1]